MRETDAHGRPPAVERVHGALAQRSRTLTLNDPVAIPAFQIGSHVPSTDAPMFGISECRYTPIGPAKRYRQIC